MMPLKTDDSQHEHTLDKLLIALQKSISRVNENSAKVSDDKARAIISGNIGFEISCNCRLVDDDKLELCDQGIEISLKGQINPDIDTIVLEEEENATTKKKTKKTKPR